MKIPGKEEISNLLKPRTLIMVSILLLVISMGILVDKWMTPLNGIEDNEFLSPGELEDTVYSAPKINNLISSDLSGSEIKIMASHDDLSDVQGDINGYIIEFNEEPLLVKETEVKSINNVLSTSAQKSLITHSKKIDNEHQDVKNDILNILSKQNHGFGSVSVSSKGKLNVLGEYKNVFNGIAIDVSADEAKMIASLNSVKKVYPNKKVNVSLMDSVPFIGADEVWELFDSNGNKITGNGTTIAIIDTGIDYTHPDLGASELIDRDFLQINNESIDYYLSRAPWEFDGQISMSDNRIIYYSANKIYLYDFETNTTDEIRALPSDSEVVKVTLKDDLFIYLVSEPERNALYLYDLNTAVEQLIVGDIEFIGDMSLSDDYIVYSATRTSTDSRGIFLYNITTGQEDTIDEGGESSNHPKISGDLVVYPVSSDYCYDKVVIHDTLTGQKTEIIPPDVGPVLDFEGDKILYVGCSQNNFDYSWRTHHLYDIVTGEHTVLRYEEESVAESESNINSDIGLSSWINKGAIGNGVIFFSKDVNANQIVGYDLNKEEYVLINLATLSGLIDAEENKVCFVSTNSNIYCHDYNSNGDYTVPEMQFNDKVIGGYDFVNDDNNPMDDHGHGTHCAGIAAGDNPNIATPDPLRELFISIEGSGHNVEIEVETSEGFMDIDILYGQNDQFIVVGEDEDERLVTSSDDSIIFDENIDRYFIVSSAMGDIYETYLLEVTDIDEVNGISIEDHNGNQIVYNKDVGDYFDLGNSVIVIINDFNETQGTVNLSFNLGSLNLSINSESYFDRVFDKNGNYVILPKQSELPIDTYSFDTLSHTGVKRMTDTFSYNNGYISHSTGSGGGNGGSQDRYPVGVAPDAQLYAYKVLDNGGSGSWSGVISGIEASMDPNGDGDFSDHVDIISLSLGGSGDPDDPVSVAVDNAVDAGVVAAVAAGNDGPSEETIGSPGTARKAITVGASYTYEGLVGFSSRGNVEWEDEYGVKQYLIKPDVLAPGYSICSAQYASAWADSECYDDEHTAISGTSMATPHVAGAAALIKQAHPTWSPYEIKLALKNTARDIGYQIHEQGFGLINVSAAVQIENKPCTAIVESASDIKGTVNLSGTATCENFDSYSISYRRSEDENWNEFYTSLVESSDNIIYPNFDTTSLGSGLFFFKITVKNTFGEEYEDIQFVDIANFKITRIGNSLNYISGIENVYGEITLGDYDVYRVESQQEGTTEWIEMCYGAQKELVNDVICSVDLNGLSNGKYQFRFSLYMNNQWFESSSFESIVLTDLMDNWPIEINGFPGGRLLVDDVDNDLVNEILVPHYQSCYGNGCRGSKIYLFEPDATYKELESFYGELSQSYRPPTDKLPSIYFDKVNSANFMFLGSYSNVGLADSDGNYLSGWPYWSDDNFRITSIMSSSDFNNPNQENNLYFSALNWDNQEVKIEGLNKSGDILENFPINIQTEPGFERIMVLNGLAMLNKNGEPRIGIIIGQYNDTSSGRNLLLYLDIYSTNGSLIKRTNIFDDTSKGVLLRMSLMAVGDLNQDNNSEIVVSYGIIDYESFREDLYNISSYNSFVKVINSEGDIISSPLSIQGYMPRHVALGDFGRGNLDIVATFSDTWPTTYDGQKVIGFDYLGNNLFDTNLEDSGDLIQGLTIGDVDGDSESEIIINQRPRWWDGNPSGIMIYNHNGILENEIEIPTFGRADDLQSNYPLLVDLDNDGDLEIVQQATLISSGASGQKTHIFVFDLDADYDSDMDWPVLLHDNQRTGTYEFEKTIAGCLDSDGGKNYYVKSSATGHPMAINQTTGQGYTNPNIETKYDECYSDDIHLFEAYCDEDTGWLFHTPGYECPDGCEDGACIGLDTSCQDSDGGYNLEEKGIVSGILKSNDSYFEGEETCVEGHEIGITNYVREYNCVYVHSRDDYFLDFDDEECSNGCEDGACLPINLSIPCVDSDGGRYPYTKSENVSGLLGYSSNPSYFEGSEECIIHEDDGSEHIQEYYCYGSTSEQRLSRSEPICYHGCQDGACIRNSTILIEEDIPPVVFTSMDFEDDYCLFGSEECVLWIANYDHEANTSIDIDVGVEVLNYTWNEEEFNNSVQEYFDLVNQNNIQKLDVLIQDNIVNSANSASSVDLVLSDVIYNNNRMYSIKIGDEGYFMVWFNKNKTIIVVNEGPLNGKSNDSFYSVVDAYLAKYPSELFYDLPDSPFPECTDSDNGLDYFVQGYVNKSGVIAQDCCKAGSGCAETSNTVAEAYCENPINSSLVYFDFHGCPNGCSNGACNPGCGDNIKNLNETCDLTDFGGLSCSDYGHNSGSLSCSNDCSVINSSACSTVNTPTSSSSSSGGGSSSKKTTYDIGDLGRGDNFQLIRRDIVNFEFKGSQHKIEVMRLTKSSVELKITSDPIEVVLSIGQEKKVDIDGDGKLDISIELEQIRSSRAYLIVEPIEGAQICNNNFICELGEDRNNCPNDCVVIEEGIQPTQEQPQYVEKVVCDYNRVCDNEETVLTCPSDCKRTSGQNVIVWIIAVLMIILLTSFVLFEYKQHEGVYVVPQKLKSEIISLLKMGKSKGSIKDYLQLKNLNDKDMRHTLNYVDSLLMLKAYVERAIKQGYNPESIKQALKENKWSKKLVEDVFNNFI
jgi:subtilisin family serine protease